MYKKIVSASQLSTSQIRAGAGMCPATLIGFHILREVSAERKAFIFPSLLTDTIITFSLTAVSMATWQGLTYTWKRTTLQRSKPNFNRCGCWNFSFSKSSSDFRSSIGSVQCIQDVRFNCSLVLCIQECHLIATLDMYVQV